MFHVDPDYYMHDPLKQIRAIYLSRELPFRHQTFTTKDVESRKHALHLRRKHRKWVRDLSRMPEMLAIYESGGSPVAVYVILFDFFWEYIPHDLNPKDLISSMKAAKKARFEYIEFLEDMQKQLDSESAALANQLADRLKTGLGHINGDVHIRLVPEYVGKAGNASVTISGQRAYFVSLLETLIPQKLVNRYSVIAKLLNHAGLDISRQHVRTILENRKRFRQ